jgi:hypothetical protein
VIWHLFWRLKPKWKTFRDYSTFTRYLPTWFSLMASTFESSSRYPLCNFWLSSVKSWLCVVLTKIRQMFSINSKAGISEVISIWSHPHKNEPNHCPSTFQSKVKSLGTVIWFIFMRMGPNLKYLLRLPHL